MHEKVQKIVTRFAPSPTGLLHIGAYRTAIFSYLFARHHGGTFVLRIEDTDKERSTKENEDNIMESLAWLDLKHDVFVRQSEQLPRHKEVMHKMIADGFAYISKEEAKDGSGAQFTEEEVKAIVEQGYNIAKNILTKNLKHLHSLAAALIEHETLSGSQIQDLLAGKTIEFDGTHSPASYKRSKETAGEKAKESPHETTAKKPIAKKKKKEE